MTDLLIERHAEISDCGAYRYWLTRRWGPGPLLTFVMLNPSTADAMIDDPTIRRCMGFGRREGASGVMVVNLFAYRATKPRDLIIVGDVFGPRNAAALGEALAGADLPVICAWGAERFALNAMPRFHQIVRDVGRMDLKCLGRTAARLPRHPLYVKADQPMEPYP